MPLEEVERIRPAARSRKSYRLLFFNVAPWNLFPTLCRTMDGSCISCMAVSCTLSLRLFFMCIFSFSCCQYLVLDVIPLFNVDCHR
jgi:hypothetical protein